MDTIFKFFAIGLTIAIVTSFTAANLESRIIGGREVDVAKHPYLVSIRYRSNANQPYVHKCAGAIYSERVVITAAQCVVDIGATERVMVVVGANSRVGLDGMPYPVLKWVAHASYSSWTVDYDIAVLVIDDVFDFMHWKAAPIRIRESRPLDGKITTVAGWGYRQEFGPSSQVLEEVQVPIVNSQDCTNAHGPGEITEHMICAGNLNSGGKDSCQGDTGGPLVLDGELVGLVSWGRGCARPKLPGVYTFVGSLKEWVDATIAANV